MPDLQDKVLTQIGAENPMDDEFSTWKEFVENKLNQMTNAELLERISMALNIIQP